MERDKAKQYKWAPVGERSVQHRKLALNMLYIDHSYQRAEINQTMIKKIKAQFDWRLFGELLVVCRGGRWYIVDGQHRYIAAKERGDILAVPCCIVAANDIAEEARLFATASEARTPIRALDRYRAKVVGKDPDYTACDSAIRAAGFAVGTDNSDCNVIQFAAELVRSWKLSPQATVCALHVQRAMIGPGQHMQSDIHKGLVYLLVNDTAIEKWLTDRVQVVYENGGRAMLLNAIATTAATCKNEGRSNRVCAIGVLECCNNGLRRKRQFKPAAKGIR